MYTRYCGSIDVNDLRPGTKTEEKDFRLPGLFDENGKLVLDKVEPFMSAERPRIFQAPESCPEDLGQVKALTEYASQVDDVLKIMGLSYGVSEPKAPR